jgi:hypothetical protein
MARQLKASGDLENSFINQRIITLIPKFEALAHLGRKQRETGKGDLEGWKNLAIKETRLLKLTYPDDRPEAEKTYGTCLRQITALKKALVSAAPTLIEDKANKSPVLTIIKHFGDFLSSQFSQYKMQQNEIYRVKVEERRQVENRIELDLTPFLEYAYKALELASQGARNVEQIRYEDVSCALALATGKRMAEIHLSAEFKQVGEYEIEFKGQLKGKSREVKGESLREATFRIPTLVPANLVVSGLDWLEANGKRFSKNEDPSRVNTRFSKPLSERVKEMWLILPKDEMTYHKFRGAYLICAWENSNNHAYDFEDFSKEVLGDEDTSTIKSYKRFKVKPGSKTKI